MIRAATVLGVLSLAWWGLAGCPSNHGPGPVEPTVEASEQPDGATVEPEVVAPPPPQEYVGEPGTLKVTATFNGLFVAAPIEVRRTGQSNVEQTQTVSGDEGVQFSLPPGRYDVRAAFPNAVDGAADVREGMRVQTGDTRTVDFAFDSISQVTLECKKGGHSVTGSIRLRRPGGTDYPFEVRCQQEFFIGGGAWEASVTLGTGHSAQSVEAPLQIVGGGVIHTPIMIEGPGHGH